MNAVTVWGYEIPIQWLSAKEVGYLNSLPKSLPDVRWVWEEMDRVWDEYGLNNKKKLSEQEIGEYYHHPVWLMNGIFTLLDPVSLSHRKSIAQYLKNIEAKKVADFGGGFGGLAQAIIKMANDIDVYIIEPYPSKIAMEYMKSKPRIYYESALKKGEYDIILAQDVLEHVEDPIKLAMHLSESVKEGGFVVFANCFYPVIKCHLPSTFHLRHTFVRVMKAMGLEYSGSIDGAAHAHVFRRFGMLNLTKAREIEKISRLIGPVLNSLSGPLSRIKRMLTI